MRWALENLLKDFIKRDEKVSTMSEILAEIAEVETWLKSSDIYEGAYMPEDAHRTLSKASACARTLQRKLDETGYQYNVISLINKQ